MSTRNSTGWWIACRWSARALRTVALYLVEGVSDDHAENDPGGRRRRLSFAGIMDAEPDLAARSEEILREEFGRAS